MQCARECRIQTAFKLLVYSTLAFCAIAIFYLTPGRELLVQFANSSTLIETGAAQLLQLVNSTATAPTAAAPNCLQISRQIIIGQNSRMTEIRTIHHQQQQQHGDSPCLPEQRTETADTAVNNRSSRIHTSMARSSNKLPNCGRDKHCLETAFVPLALERILAEDKTMWSYLLQETNYEYEIISHVNASCEADSASGPILVIYVHSHPEHYDRRQLARSTWGRLKNVRGVKVILTFGIGTSPRETVRKAVREEARQFGDILEGTFSDAYHNMTLKHRMGIKWLYDHCPQSAYFLKIDDDVIPNIYRLADMVVDVLPWLPDLRFVCSMVLINNRPHRKGKWEVTEEDYALTTYPHKLCPGRAYIAPTVLMLRVAALMPHVRFVWLDDVWVTSVLGAVAGAEYTPVTYKNFGRGSLSKAKQDCFFDIQSGSLTKGLTLVRKTWEQENRQYKKWPGGSTPPC